MSNFAAEKLLIRGELSSKGRTRGGRTANEACGRVELWVFFGGAHNSIIANRPPPPPSPLPPWAQSCFHARCDASASSLCVGLGEPSLQWANEGANLTMIKSRFKFVQLRWSSFKLMFDGSHRFPSFAVVFLFFSPSQHHHHQHYSRSRSRSIE